MVHVNTSGIKVYDLPCNSYRLNRSSCVMQALLGEWWALVNEVPAAAAAAVDLDKAGFPTSKRQFEREAREDSHPGASTSLLDDVEQDAFLPG